MVSMYAACLVIIGEEQQREEVIIEGRGGHYGGPVWEVAKTRLRRLLAGLEPDFGN